MPHSSLDLLKCFGAAKNVCDADFYIKLKTEERGLRYYYGNRHALLPAVESRYLSATQNARFDINCKNLKELRIVEHYNGDGRLFGKKKSQSLQLDFFNHFT